jgi:son of sevenless-like protein
MADKSYRAKPPTERTVSVKSQQPAVNMHLMKMVERATTDYYYDISYIHDLLLAYRCFTTPTNMFDLLVQRYHASPPEGISMGELEAWHKSQKVIQLRVIIFLKRWIDGYHTDFDSPGMEDRLVAFDKTLPSAALGGTSTFNPASNSEDIQLIMLLQRKRNPRGNATTPAMPMYPQPWFPSGNTDSLEIADVQALEMARQICLIQSALFVAVRPREYLQYCAERAGSQECWVDGDPSEQVAPNVHALSKWSRSLSKLVASDIVNHSDKSRRAATLERFIEVADKCAALKNFDAVFNIMEGITHPAIERLADTFKLLSPSANKLLSSLKQLVSKDGDLKQYREVLTTSNPPTLPYFESILEEMWFTECSSPKVLNGGIVNFFHYRQIARKAFTYQQYMPQPYQFRPVPPLQKLLIRSPDELLDDEQLKRKSLLREEPSYF